MKGIRPEIGISERIPTSGNHSAAAEVARERNQTVQADGHGANAGKVWLSEHQACQGSGRTRSVRRYRKHPDRDSAAMARSPDLLESPPQRDFRKLSGLMRHRRQPPNRKRADHVCTARQRRRRFTGADNALRRGTGGSFLEFVLLGKVRYQMYGRDPFQMVSSQVLLGSPILAACHGYYGP